MAVLGATIHELAVGASICLRIKFVTVSRINLWLPGRFGWCFGVIGGYQSTVPNNRPFRRCNKSEQKQLEKQVTQALNICYDKPLL